MTRKTGMVIDFYRPRSIRIPFAGLFQCDDRRGNSLLKGLEPPQHNKWDESRAKTSQQKDVLKEIKAWISSSLKSMIPNLDAKVINEDAIADLLPDDLPGENSSDNEETDLGGKPAVAPDTTKPETPKPQVRTPGAGGEGLGKGGLGGGKGDTIDPKKGDGESTGGQKGRTGPDGEQGGGATSSRVRIDLRCYPGESGNGTYNLVARATSDHTGDLRIDAVTEDGSPISCPLSKAFDKDGNPVAVSGNRISGVSIPANGSLRLQVVLERPMRVALRASAL